MEGLEFYFRDGIAKIYYQGRPITSAVGLEASFVLNGDYYSSPYFQWSSEVVTPQRLVIYAKAEGLPLLMRWEIEIRNDHEIDWKVSMDALFQKRVHNFCLSLFLIRRYTQWASSLGRNDLRAMGFYIKTGGEFLDKQSIFCGTISFSQREADILN